jgi:peptide/nickel transport system substrate-binding protein
MSRDTGPNENRRRLLKSLGAAGLVGLAGCSTSDSTPTGTGGGGGGDIDVTETDAFTLYEQGFQEAGFEPPFTGEIITNENPERVQWAQIIQEELNSTEYFDLELSQFEWGTYVGRVLGEESHTDPSLVCLGWSGGFDPDDYVNFLFTSDNFTPACCNINHYENSTVDELVKDGLTTSDIDERADIYEDVQREIVSDSPIAFTRFGEEYNVWRSDRVHGFQTYPNNSVQFLALFAPWADTFTWVGDGGSVQSGGTLTTSLSAAPSNSDPVRLNDTTSSMVTNPIYESLLGVDFDGEPQPVLAESVEQVDDTTYSVTLRQGVEFHASDESDFDGREVVAEDVRFSIMRYLNTSRESDVADWLGVEGEEDDREFVGTVEVLGDYELEISLPEPYSPFRFSIAAVPVVPQEAGYPEAHPNSDTGTLDLSAEPIGTGPFTFVEEQPDELWRIERNENYWFEGTDDIPAQPPLEQVDMRVITESSVQEGALQSGDIDIATSPPPGSVANFEQSEEFTVDRRVASGFDLFIYPSHPEADTPFQNRKVRIATNRMINRPGIVEAVYEGIGQPAYAPISPLAGAFTSPEFQEEMATLYSRYHGDADR